MSAVLFALAVVTNAAAAAATHAPALTAPTPIPVPTPIAVPSGLQQSPTFFPPQTFATTHPWVVSAIEYLFLAATLGIIVLMSVQTTKTEGLSGTVGGRAEVAYRGRLGFDQQITRITAIVAIVWFVLAAAYFLVTR